MRGFKASLLAATVVAALVAGAAQAAAPSVTITTEAGVILNAPMLPSEAGIQLNGHIDGIASSDVALDCEDCSVTVEIADGEGEASFECDDVECHSGTWVFFPSFPILPGDYLATATVVDADGASASDEVNVTVL